MNSGIGFSLLVLGSRFLVPGIVSWFLVPGVWLLVACPESGLLVGSWLVALGCWFLVFHYFAAGRVYFQVV